jgi:hypothetical protein
MITSTPNDGSQGWKVPGLANTTGKIRVVSISYPQFSDISDTHFTIAQSIAVLLREYFH